MIPRGIESHVLFRSNNPTLTVDLAIYIGCWKRWPRGLRRMNFAQLPGVWVVGSKPTRNNKLFSFSSFFFCFFLFQFFEFSFLTFLLFKFFLIQLYLKKPEIISTESRGWVYVIRRHPGPGRTSLSDSMFIWTLSCMQKPKVHISYFASWKKNFVNFFLFAKKKIRV